MGFSLRPLGRRIWEGITPNDEGAQRRANANLVRANQALQQPAKYGALRNQQTKNQFVKSQQPVKFSVSTAARDSFTQRAVPSVSAGLARSAVGTAEGLSGLYDLATPGLGTNRFTKKTVELGGGIDRFVDKNNLDKTGYKLGQFSGEAASFLAPSAFAKSLAKGAKAGGVVGKGANFLAKTDPLINKTGLKYLSKPSTYTNVIPGVARMSGYRTARGQDVSPQTVAQDTAISLTFGKALDTVGNRVAEPVFSKLRKPEVQLPKQPKPTVKVKPNAEFNAQLKKLDGEVNTLRRSPATPEGEARLRAVRKEQAELKQKIKNNKNQTGGGFLGEEPTIKNVYGEDVPNPNYIDPKVSIRMQKDYIEAMPPRKGSALSGEGAQLPSNVPLSPLTRAKAIAEARAKARAKVGNTDPLDSLKQEARKYKSAEEFVKAQTNLYHGTKADFSEFDPNLLGTNTGAPSAKKGFFFTDNEQLANHYANPGRNQGTAISKNLEDAMGRAVERAKKEGLDNSLSNNTGGAMVVGSWPKTAKATEVKSSILSKMETLKSRFDSPEDIKKINRFQQLVTEELDNTKLTDLELSGKVLKSKVNLENPMVFDDNGLRNGASYAKRIDEAIAKGHDGVIIKNTQDPFRGDIHVAFDKNQILTEKQLTDLYNQANKPKVGFKKMDQVGGGATGDSEVLSVLRKLKGEGLSIGQRLSPDRVIREGITEPLREGVNKAIFKAQTSDNPLLQGAGRLTTGVSRELGTSQELMAAKRALHGGVETGKLLREDIADAGKGFDKLSKERIWATLDPEQANKTGTKLLSTLTPEEVAHRNVLVQQRDSVTNELSKRGLLTPEQANKQDYFKRAYSIFEESSDNSKAYNQTRAALLKQFKGRKDVTGDLLDTAIKDPDWLMAKKTAEAHSAMAMVDYGSTLKKMGMTSDVPKAGYVQLPSSKVFGEAAGKYVPKGVSEDFTGFQYNNGMMSAFNDMITAYDSLGIRKAKKELLTIFNPAVRVGNQFSNRVVFSNLNGINPVQFNKNMFLAKAEIKNRGPLYREAVSQGLTGLDVTQADFARRISQYADDPNVAKKSIEYAKKSYSQADDQARIAAYMTHRNRGYSPEEAAKLTQRGFQDYKSVGFFYDIAAKTPLVGNAFVRFAADAVRIAGNAALDHPLRSIATIALWANFVNIMSKVSGESAEDKKTREDRFGAPKLPFSNISTAVQTPWGEVNVSRFLPFYQLNETQSSIGKFLPIQGNPLNPKNWNDPLLGQFGQIAKDKDFRDKSIRDPDNSGQFKDKLPQSQQVKNVARFLGVGNMPLGKEIDAVTSAIRGTGDIYGKKRSVPQALARAMGVKVEQQGAEQQKATRGMNDYYDEKAKIDEQVKGMEPKDQEAYKRVTGYYKLREKTTNEFDTSKQRYVKDAVYNFPEDKWKEYTTSPKIYDLMMEKKIKDSQKQGSPLQPEFDKTLSTEFRKQLINNKSQAPGEDVEADERLYSSSEWDTYQKLKADYSAKAKKYYPQKNGEFKDELVKHETSQFPAKPPAKAAYDAAYAKYAKGQGPKPTFNDQVAAAKDKYTEDKRVWTNNERKARGLPPISQEVWNNVTFGFESDEEKVYKQLKYGKGYGGYASGGGGSGASSYYGKSKSSVKGKVATPSIKGKAPVKLKGSVKYTAAGKPKVSIKKALT